MGVGVRQELSKIETASRNGERHREWLQESEMEGGRDRGREGDFERDSEGQRMTGVARCRD